MPTHYTWRDLPDNNTLDITPCSDGDVFLRVEQLGDEKDVTARVYIGAHQARQIACELIRASYEAEVAMPNTKKEQADAG